MVHFQAGQSDGKVDPFGGQFDKNLGGNSIFRSPERIVAEKRYLQKKWEAHITIDTY